MLDSGWTRATRTDEAREPLGGSKIIYRYIINSLTIINDTAERAVKLMEDFNATLTLDEEQKQFL